MEKICRINAKTKKWPERIAFHFSLVNRWIDYRAIYGTYESSKLQILNLTKFKKNVVEFLIKAK